MISVIVPIYNVEAYLEKCILSIVNQTYQELEIILVNDGSTDRSGDICKKFEADKRIKLINKANGGLSDARNKGLECATGEYIAFIDSDDYVHPQMFEIMHKFMQKEQADVVACNFQKVTENEIVTYKSLNSNNLSFEIFDKEEALCQIDKVFVIACNKLYRREIFSMIRFTKGRLHEDEFVIHHILNRCDKIVVLNTPLYYYVQRDNSIMATMNMKRILDKREALRERMELVLNSSIPKAIVPTVSRLLDYQIEIHEVMKRGDITSIEDITEIRELQKSDEKYIRDIIKENHVTIEKKYKLFLVHPDLYEINRIGLKSFLAIKVKHMLGMRI